MASKPKSRNFFLSWKLRCKTNAFLDSWIPFTARLDHGNQLPRLSRGSEWSRSPNADTLAHPTMSKLFANWSFFSLWLLTAQTRFRLWIAGPICG